MRKKSKKKNRQAIIGYKKIMLNEIKIPWCMTQSIPKKYNERLNYFLNNNKLCRPIEVDEKMKLIDGYSSYLILNECNIDEHDVVIRKYNCPNTFRKNIYSIRKIEALLDKANYPITISSVTKRSGDTNRKIKITIHGESIRKYSANIVVFFAKGYKCVSCGIQGKFFALENNGGVQNGYSLKLYALNEEGHEVLMTVDHIIPRAKGGANNLENLQPMCVHCNNIKAHFESNSYT